VNAPAARILASIVIVVASAVPAQASLSSRYDDDGHSINAIGDGKFFIGDCTGKAVRLIGNRQTIVLLGTCKSIVSRGSDKRITLDGASSLDVTGDGNTVKWKTKPPSVKAAGRNNQLTRT
jgi:hypothetical protein